MKLVHKIDCTAAFPAENFISCGATRIVRAPCGSYRESAPEALSRFCYRLQLTAQRPYLLKVFYPDDKRRFMTIGDGTSYDANTAITSGYNWPLSGKMLTLEEIFWPRFADFSLCFMAFGCDEPAAAAGFEIYELDAEDLPELRPEPPAGGGREFALMYEDPCGTGLAEGAIQFEDWLDRVVGYMKFTGQNCLAYPICWYHGPLYPNDTERVELFGMTALPDRSIYVAWSEKPEDWLAVLLERFDCEALGFYGVCTLLRLSSLMKLMNIDLEAIQAGAPTINNMLWNNQVQSGTMDWTGVYNTILFNDAEKMMRDGGLYTNRERTFAYGELSGQKDIPVGPIFNPLHPLVQEHIIKFFGDASRRYAGHAAFKGFSITLWAPTLVWFGSLRSGYDDWTIAEFEHDTGIRIPVTPHDPERFSKRYDYLIYQCRECWIHWRCARIRRFIAAIRDTIIAVRPDLRLSLTLWNEPLIPAVRGMHRPENQIGVRDSMLEIYREAGIDPRDYAREPNIDFVLQTEGGSRDRSYGNSRATPLEGFHMFRDHDFLDASVWDVLRGQTNPGVFVFNAWHEAWGRHVWNPAMIPPEAEIYGTAPDGVCRVNSEYTPDGFWWKNQLRISPAAPPAPHYMEYFAHALAECDALRLSAGGLFMDKTHFREFRRFNAVFRRLPALRFETLPGSGDPVTVRSLHGNGELYCYMINREYYPSEVTIELHGGDGGENLADGQPVANAGTFRYRLGPYELAGFRWRGGTLELRKVEPDARMTGKIKTTAETQLRLLESYADRPDAVVFPSLPDILKRLRRALDRSAWAEIRRILQSYPVRLTLQKLNTEVLDF